MTWLLAAIVIVPVVILIQLAQRGNTVAVSILVIGCLASFVSGIVFFFFSEPAPEQRTAVDIGAGLQYIHRSNPITVRTWLVIVFLSGFIFWPASIWAALAYSAEKNEREMKLQQKVKEQVTDIAEQADSDTSR